MRRSVTREPPSAREVTSSTSFAVRSRHTAGRVLVMSQRSPPAGGAVMRSSTGGA
ncbi:MAG: hypothetical protein IPJ04_06740 [Candidatus Eisenbacteria bacterium]|nr:hypothetical protein [Candidatus Eisenbacteria bacterium]